MKFNLKEYDFNQLKQLVTDLKISNNYLLEENKKLRKQLKEFVKKGKGHGKKEKLIIYDLETQISDLQDHLDYIDINSENYEVFKLKLNQKKIELKKFLSKLGDTK
ncbi:hypothetical protein [Fructilactobacillus sanfranciscensis]|uniref:hypothetical protein n=1 Tax=Fructilactobacillus sanfranciscensis TaxID=1625 RepID=UPI0011197436|nr:hypothetical protein [Fructilactobacillus sanfranciscensis]TNK96811.1 hypothetical protein DKP75_06705 [Fructilactobacillus sanfranciscensis]